MTLGTADFHPKLLAFNLAHKLVWCVKKNRKRQKEAGEMEPTEDEVVRPEEVPERPRPHTVHGARLQVHQGSPGHVFLSWKRTKPTPKGHFLVSRVMDCSIANPPSTAAWMVGSRVSSETDFLRSRIWTFLGSQNMSTGRGLGEHKPSWSCSGEETSPSMNGQRKCQE